MLSVTQGYNANMNSSDGLGNKSCSLLKLLQEEMVKNLKSGVLYDTKLPINVAHNMVQQEKSHKTKHFQIDYSF